MLVPFDAASPLDLAALWQLDLLSGDDIAAVCMRWLAEDLDGGNPNIAAFAGRRNLTLAEAGPTFERVLGSFVGRGMAREEAVLRGLRFHLAAALEEDRLMDGVGLALHRFADLSDQRLVRNPRRDREEPDGVYAAENLGLEYVYGGFYAFDDIQALSPDEKTAAEAALSSALRQDVLELHNHLASLLGEPKLAARA